jgi:hypothetical protein
VVNICGAIVAVYVILAVVDFEPEIRQFFIAIVVVLLTIRVTWILYSALVINVLMGYDLDKALQMKKMAWSILNVGVFHSAAKVLGHGGDEASTVASSGTSLTGCHGTVGGASHGEDDAAYTKAMAKFSKSKNSGDLQYEIDKIKKEIADRQSELACLENMKFASDHSNSSSNKSGSHMSSHAEENHSVTIRSIPENRPTKVEKSENSFIKVDVKSVREADDGGNKIVEVV